MTQTQSRPSSSDPSKTSGSQSSGSQNSGSRNSGSQDGSGSRVPERRPDSPLVTPKGTTTIADSVVGKIAGIAASDVSGVHALGGGASRAMGSLLDKIPGTKSSSSQGVSVSVEEQTATVEVTAIVDYGIAIADVASAIRSNIIRSVEQMTGMHVDSVDVSVTDIHLPGEDSDDDDEK